MKEQRGSLLTDQSQILLTEPLMPLDQNQPSKQNQFVIQSSLSPISQPKQKQRLLSLDVLRGLTIVGMCIVDSLIDNRPWWLKHPSWNGLTIADFIFPSFLFIMGMAIPLSLSPSKPFRLKNLLRIIGLFVIGILLNILEDNLKFAQFQLMGILQRLALCYGGLCFIHVITNYGDQKYRFVGFLLAAACGLVYITFMITFETQDCPHQKNLTRSCNFSTYLDKIIIGEVHMGGSFQPEGLFTTLTAFLNAYAGYWFCLTMFDYKNSPKTIVKLWLIAGTLCCLISIPLCWLMPFNKKLWSINYTFLTMGVSGISLALITILVDMTGKNNPKYQKVISTVIAPSIWLGRNPLAIFVTREILDDVLSKYIIINDVSAWKHIYQILFDSWIGVKEISSIMFSTMILLVLILQAYVLYRNNIFIKL